MTNWKKKDSELTCSWQECAYIKSQLLAVTLSHLISPPRPHLPLRCWQCYKHFSNSISVCITSSSSCP